MGIDGSFDILLGERAQRRLPVRKMVNANKMMGFLPKRSATEPQMGVTAVNPRMNAEPIHM